MHTQMNANMDISTSMPCSFGIIPGVRTSRDCQSSIQVLSKLPMLEKGKIKHTLELTIEALKGRHQTYQ